MDSLLHLKEHGNELFKINNFQGAAALYLQALDEEVIRAEIDRTGDAVGVSQLTAVILCNLSACHFRLGELDKALLDADGAVQRNAKNCKAHYRRGAALEALGRGSEAIKAFEAAAVLDPQNTEIKGRIAALRSASSAEQLCGAPLKCAGLTRSPPNGVLVKNHLLMSNYPIVDASALVESFDSPVMKHLGIPLAVAYAPGEPRKGDNQLATYFMVDVDNGFADSRWQTGNIGPVVIFRRDGVSLAISEVSALWDFFCVLLDDFGNGSPPRITREYFLNWQESYAHLCQQPMSRSDPNMRPTKYFL